MARTRLWAVMWILGGATVLGVFWRVYWALGASSSKLEVKKKLQQKKINNKPAPDSSKATTSTPVAADGDKTA